MIKDWQLQRDGERIILGLATESAILDVITDRQILGQCLLMLNAPHRGLADCQMGCFGEYPIRLNLHADESVSIFIDGPQFDPTRCQSAAIWVTKNELCAILQKILS